jgi:hypothetical protein
VYKLLDEILCALNNKVHVDGIFCDLAEASDCVNHDILLAGFEVLMTVSTKMAVFWVVAPCSLVEI